MRVLATILFGWLVLATTAHGANPTRYVARMANFAFVEGNTLSDWHAPESIPKLEAQPLFDPSNPLRWLVDRSLMLPEPPSAFVELFSGDRLPGAVVDYRGGDESAFDPLPPHFLVRHENTNPASLDKQTTTIRVNARFVRRIVWEQQQPTKLQPRTVHLRDGSYLAFRSARFAPGALSLLLESGPRRLAFAEIAEIHLPPIDFWPAYVDELAQLAPDGQRRLLQLESVTGLVVTSSLERLLPRVVGDPRDVQRWVLGVQPAWSLDVLWIQQSTIWMRRSFAPYEVPLTRVPVLRDEQRSPVGAVKWPFASNRSLSGGPLRSGTRETGWGFAVHAFAELEFELPAMVRTFRADFAIDEMMREGGCVQARVLNVSAGNAAIFQSPIVVGSESVIDTGAIGIAGSGESPRRMTLQVDPVVANRPANADPFDIRDHAVWIDPFVEFDAGLLKQQIDARLSRQSLAWRGWDFVAEPGAQVQRGNFFAEAPGNGGGFHPSVAVAGGPLKLSRTHTFAADDAWLVVDAVRTQPPGPPCKLSIKLADAMPFEWDVPAFDKGGHDFRPYVLSLAELRAIQPTLTSLPIEIRQLPPPESVPVLWRAIAITSQHPMFYRLLEDELPSTNRRATSSAAVAMQLDDQQKYVGRRSLKMPAPAEMQISTPLPVIVRERPRLGEYRFLRFAVRKQKGGTLRVVVNHTSESERPAVFEAGPNLPEELSVKRLLTTELPSDWFLVTRDLFGDFGNLEVSGLTIHVPDGEIAWLDHVYFGRTQSDLEVARTLVPTK